MKTIASFAVLLESFFSQRLMKQRRASPHTIKSYRDTFHLLLQFSQQHLGKQPSQLELTDLDAPLITAFLDAMEKARGISPRTRNVRLAALRS
jgi:integrase/recombinase XerD